MSPPSLSQSMNRDQHNTTDVHKSEPDGNNAGTVAVSKLLTNQVATVEIKTLWSPTSRLEIPPTYPINKRTSENKR